jgi:signal transduction histidine kinase
MSVELLLRKDDLSASQLSSVRRIGSSTDKMLRMISDILDFARGRLGGGIPLEPQPANLHEIARQAVDELAVAHPERVLEFHAEGDGSGQFDPDRLSQVVGNLVSNALSHGQPRTPVRITVRDAGPQVVLEVHNTGMPIPPQFLPRIFEPFRQGEARLSSRGLGLGLYIVAEVVKAHGGTVEARSTAEEGTTFTVRLPRAKAS